MPRYIPAERDAVEAERAAAAVAAAAAGLSAAAVQCACVVRPFRHPLSVRTRRATLLVPYPPSPPPPPPLPRHRLAAAASRSAACRAASHRSTRPTRRRASWSRASRPSPRDRAGTSIATRSWTLGRVVHQQHVLRTREVHLLHVRPRIRPSADRRAGLAGRRRRREVGRRRGDGARGPLVFASAKSMKAVRSSMTSSEYQALTEVSAA
jgi:hypothetical protein